MVEPLSMDRLQEGQSARVICVDAEPHMRRRLLDIGLIPDAEVICEGRSPAGDPAAYLIGGAVIALRAKDVSGVLLEPGPAVRGNV